jgi:hypothetical protein
MKYNKKFSKRQRGGNLGQSYAFGGPITPGAPIGNTAEVLPMSSCMATQRFGEISYPTTGLGLPGMSGGKRRQEGGRYSFDLSAPVPAAAAPWAGGPPPVMRIPCESSITTANPLNQHGGVGGVDSAFYAAPTAGYTNVASTWLGSTGSPSLLQTPYEARTTPPVCFKTGGGKRRGTKRRGTKRRGTKRRGTKRRGTKRH